MNGEIRKVELWGGPKDGLVQDILNPTDSLSFTEQGHSYLYDFKHQLPTGILLYQMRKEVRV